MKEVVKPQDGGEEIRRIRTLEAKLRELQVSPGPGKPFRAMKKGHLVVEVFLGDEELPSLGGNYNKPL